MTPVAQIGMVFMRSDFGQDLPATLAFMPFGKVNHHADPFDIRQNKCVFGRSFFDKRQ